MRWKTSVLAGSLLACSSSRSVSIPALDLAPQPLTQMSVHVDTHLDVSGYWARKGLGHELARALNAELAAALGKAGYRTEAKAPDLVARISSTLAGSTKNLDSKTTLEILHQGRLIERIEVASPMAQGTLSAEAYPEFVAVTLVNALSRSGSIASIATKPFRELTPEVALGPPVIAVFDVEDGTGALDDQAVQQLGDYLAVRTTKVIGYRVVPQGDVRARLDRSKAESYRHCVDTACQIELGKALSAQKILVAKLIRLGSSCVLAGTIYDLETETAESAESVKTACGRDLLFDAADHLVSSLKPVQ